jgi:Serine aminopeptidase, S33
MMQDTRAIQNYHQDPLIHHGRFEARFLGEFTAAAGFIHHRIAGLTLPILIVHGADDDFAVLTTRSVARAGSGGVGALLESALPSVVKRAGRRLVRLSGHTSTTMCSIIRQWAPPAHRYP